MLYRNSMVFVLKNAHYIAIDLNKCISVRGKVA